MTNESTATPEPPKRLRAADVIAQQADTIEALTSRPARGDVSVAFTRNAKGGTQIDVKVATVAGMERADLDNLATDAFDVAAKLYEDACAKYPTDTGLVRNEGQS